MAGVWRRRHGASHGVDDGIDADCAGPSDFDADGDGYLPVEHGGTDCSDDVAGINPEAGQLCAQNR